jgi:hypothetical protein
MKKISINKASMVSLFLIATLQCLQAQHKIASSQKKRKDLRILMIGDSNTEIGNITMPLKALLDGSFGDYGTGFFAH